MLPLEEMALSWPSAWSQKIRNPDAGAAGAACGANAAPVPAGPVGPLGCSVRVSEALPAVSWISESPSPMSGVDEGSLAVGFSVTPSLIRSVPLPKSVRLEPLLSEARRRPEHADVRDLAERIATLRAA